MAGRYEAVLDVEPAQLEFQNFVLNSAEANLSGSFKKAPPPVAASSSSSALPDFLAPGAAPRTGGTSAFWTLEFYAQFFNVDFEDVRTRITEAVIPRGAFQEKISGNPDLYGPFWISTTVIFCLFMTSTVAGSISAYLNSQKDYTFSMTLLTMASISVYVYVMVMPALALNVYGYGLAIWIPVSVLCILPSEIFRWVIILAAFSISSPPAKTAALVAVVLGNLTLTLIFRFGFFRYLVMPSTTPMLHALFLERVL
ncbi:hypothetical protein BC829DRAFT_393454 [Chytridium lagenaria]|nr:hypothetical protein BC829DRAFT_393454 [Chytridium lagenaria]